MNLDYILSTVVAIAVAISVHEFGHAYSAHLLGDDTAKMYGRMTINPAKHIDPIGLLMMIIFKIGWAKPVPVNPNNFKNYKIGNVLVSFSGAIANIITAIICVLINKYINMYAINLIASMTMIYNVGFAAFNLLPLPPLDGWGIVSTFIPYKYNEYVYRYENMSSIIFLVLIFTGLVGIFVEPIRDIIINIVFLFA
ncbi:MULTISPECIES: site-2 protease family protein [Romboutsia]|uniref:Peptidase, M50 n=1 Tax=Romboutsia hominis TaxID=1507512 RepID=A0A2P2BT93_9FIRM|nr:MULTISPECIES: site-2 protease family protein [Romboutsia]MCH1960870.1 site-2 protease family protein [Romboutsia hominis]MCH1968697.1 site-2 protease family protein [Romboutsia hominis]MDB8789653.1 site-2 protease family protein [Romboutsia sp. 1001216sp1]MDB8793010.1 site-2 protease family protein [Romboutsia sp. 1001216sp1]MDB8795187.1 site-2 protease family protein [Romboutsia sp. 1001216sp1]